MNLSSRSLNGTVRVDMKTECMLSDERLSVSVQCYPVDVPSACYNNNNNDDEHDDDDDGDDVVDDDEDDDDGG